MEALGYNGENRRVAIYIRVSTSEQKIDGYSLTTQKRRLLEYIDGNKAQNYDTKDEWIFSDVHTGSDLARSGLNELRKCIAKKEIDAVLIWKIDRLSRSLEHLLLIFDEMEKNEISFISVQENIDFHGPIGKLIFQIFGAIAQFERELIKGRTLMGIIGSAEMGNYTGTSIPYGYKPVKSGIGDGKMLLLIEKEKRIVERIFDWFIYYELGAGQIAEILNKLRIPKGEHVKARHKYSKWTAVIVRNILQNSLYRGEYIANKKDELGKTLPVEKWTIVKIPACVSELVFQQAKTVNSMKVGGRHNDQYLLSGKLRDMTLAKPKAFSGAKRTKGGYSYRRKQFNANGIHYPVFEIPGKPLDEFVWGKIMDAMKDPGKFIDQYMSGKSAKTKLIESLQNDLSKLREKKAEVELSISRIERAYENGTYSEEKMAEKVREKRQEGNEVETDIQDLEAKILISSAAKIEVQKLKAASAQVKQELANFTPRQKKILVGLFIEKIEIFCKKEGKRREVQIEISFSFTPSVFDRQPVIGRTGKELQLKQNAQKLPDEGNFGARERT